MENETPWKAPKYTKPPIIERVLSVVGEMPQEAFFAKFEEWKQIVQPHFPEYDPIKDWKLNIEMKEGIPMLSDALPEIRIKHRFWKLNAQGKRFLSMRVSPNKFSLNLHREDDQPHHFEELHFAFEQWMPQWMAHFGVKGCSSVSLDYINLLSAATTPQFVKEDRGIQLDQALTVFTGIPGGPHITIIPPYDCQMGLLIDPARLAMFAIRIHGMDMPKFGGISVRVDFKATVTKDSACLSSHQILSESHYLHKLIIQYFESVFTEGAKKAFEPA